MAASLASRASLNFAVRSRILSGSVRYSAHARAPSAFSAARSGLRPPLQQLAAAVLPLRHMPDKSPRSPLRQRAGYGTVILHHPNTFRPRTIDPGPIFFAPTGRFSTQAAPGRIWSAGSKRLYVGRRRYALITTDSFRRKCTYSNKKLLRKAHTPRRVSNTHIRQGTRVGDTPRIDVVRT